MKVCFVRTLYCVVLYVHVAPSDWSAVANISGTAASWNVIHCPGVSGIHVHRRKKMFGLRGETFLNMISFSC